MLSYVGTRTATAAACKYIKQSARATFRAILQTFQSGLYFLSHFVECAVLIEFFKNLFKTPLKNLKPFSNVATSLRISCHVPFTPHSLRMNHQPRVGRAIRFPHLATNTKWTRFSRKKNTREEVDVYLSLISCLRCSFLWWCFLLPPNFECVCMFTRIFVFVFFYGNAQLPCIRHRKYSTGQADYSLTFAFKRGG